MSKINTFTQEKIEPNDEKKLQNINPFDRDEFGERMNMDHNHREEKLMQKMNDLLDEKSQEILNMTVERQKLQTQIALQHRQLKTLQLENADMQDTIKTKD